MKRSTPNTLEVSPRLERSPAPARPDARRHPAEASRPRIPAPYRAMLAVCSDLDETPDRHAYLETMRFLNTTQVTAMGPGVGLEVGNTIYFDMPPGQFSYWNTDDAGREMIRTLIRSGHIDCLHSYGDLATQRRHAARALHELERHGCRLKVWIDHGVAPTNFGADRMCGSGDEPGSPVYHADLTCGYGIRYVWRGRVTSMIGQNVPPSWSNMFTPRHPLASGRTWLKERVKHGLARRGHAKYAMHAANQVLRPVYLRNGSRVWEFMRCNPHWGGLNRGDTAEGVPEVLCDSFLDTLVQRQGVCILYTHLGKTRSPERPFNEAAVRAWRRLADRYHAGEVLVTTTRRALDYLFASESDAGAPATADSEQAIPTWRRLEFPDF